MATTTAPTTVEDASLALQKSLTKQLEDIRRQHPPLQAQQQEILKKRDGYQARLDQAKQELEETRNKYALECRAAVEDAKANPQKYQDRIRQLEASIVGLEAAITEHSAASSDLDRQFREISAQEEPLAFRIRDLELTREVEAAEQADREADRVKTQTAERVIRARQARVLNHYGGREPVATYVPGHLGGEEPPAVPPSKAPKFWNRTLPHPS